MAQCQGSGVTQREQWVQTDQPWRRAVIQDGRDATQARKRAGKVNIVIKCACAWLPVHGSFQLPEHVHMSRLI